MHCGKKCHLLPVRGSSSLERQSRGRADDHKAKARVPIAPSKPAVLCQIQFCFDTMYMWDVWLCQSTQDKHTNRTPTCVCRRVWYLSTSYLACLLVCMLLCVYAASCELGALHNTELYLISSLSPTTLPLFRWTG